MYAVGDDERAYEVFHGHASVAVEPQVLELLLFLIAHRERVVPKEELLGHVWKGRIVSESTLSSRIKAARKALGDDGDRQSVIRTIYGRGFRFVADVQIRAPAERNARVEAASATPHDTAPPATRYAEVGGVHVAYQVFGAGDVDLVIVPGFVSNVDSSWDNPEHASWLRYFSGFARVVVFDKRGTGLSDREGRLPTVDERMEDVSAVMDAAGLRAAALLGISEGGALACLFAAAHPERCRALVLCGSFAQLPSWMKSEKARERFRDYVRTSWGTGKSLPRYAPSMVGSAAFERWWARFERVGASPRAALDLLHMNSEIDIVDILSTLRAPALVVHRQGDHVVELAAGELLARLIPGALLLKTNGSDHLPWVGPTLSEELPAMRRFLEGATSDLEPDHVLATVVLVAHFPSDELSDSLRREAERWRGRVVRRRSHTWAATFDAPGRSLRFASSVCARAPEARVAVHTGEVRLRASGVEGVAVDLAEAMVDWAKPGQVVVSRTVTDLVAGSGLEFDDLGPSDLDPARRGWHFYQMRLA